nr:helix-turn-helix transcriptional regulator [Silvimonas soli]
MRLKKIRKEAGLSQKAVGIAAGLDPNVASTRLNRYELGIHQVEHAMAKKLAEVLKVPTAYFFAEDEELAEFILLFARADEATKKRLLEELRSAQN